MPSETLPFGEEAADFAALVAAAACGALLGRIDRLRVAPVVVEAVAQRRGAQLRLQQQVRAVRFQPLAEGVADRLADEGRREIGADVLHVLGEDRQIDRRDAAGAGELVAVVVYRPWPTR